MTGAEEHSTNILDENHPAESINLQGEGNSLPNSDDDKSAENQSTGNQELEEQASEEPKIREREPIIFLKKYCTHLAGSECNRCSLACPHDAITITDASVEINESLCTRCGICAGICDAFASKRVTLSDLMERVESIIKLGDAVYFTCNEHLFPGFEPNSNVIVLPCFACLPPEFWTCVLATAKDTEVYLYCDPRYCNDCLVAGPFAHELFTHSIELAQTWTQKSILLADSIPERQTLINKYASIDQEEDYDRRKMLSSFTHEMVDIASGKHRKKNSKAVQEFLERKERMRAEGMALRENEASLASIAFPDLKEAKLWPRRELLSKAIKQNPSIAEEITQYCSCTDCEACALCKTCITQCPTGARSIDENTNTVKVDPLLCIICGICVSKCPQDVIDYEQITADEFIVDKTE